MAAGSPWEPSPNYFVTGMHIIIGMPPHIIITGAPIAIIELIASQRSFMRDIIEASVGIIFIIMPSFVISQDILHIMDIMAPFIMGIIMLFMGIMPFIMGIPIMGIMPFIMGIPIMGIMPFMFIGIPVLIGIPIMGIEPFIGMAFIESSSIEPFG